MLLIYFLSVYGYLTGHYPLRIVQPLLANAPTAAGHRVDSSTLETGCLYQDSANAASVSCAANVCFYDRNE